MVTSRSTSADDGLDADGASSSFLKTGTSGASSSCNLSTKVQHTILPAPECANLVLGLPYPVGIRLRRGMLVAAAGDVVRSFDRSYGSLWQDFRIYSALLPSLAIYIIVHLVRRNLDRSSAKLVAS